MNLEIDLWTKREQRKTSSSSSKEFMRAEGNEQHFAQVSNQIYPSFLLSQNSTSTYTGRTHEAAFPLSSYVQPASRIRTTLRSDDSKAPTETQLLPLQPRRSKTHSSRHTYYLVSIYIPLFRSSISRSCASYIHPISQVACTGSVNLQCAVYNVPMYLCTYYIQYRQMVTYRMLIPICSHDLVLQSSVSRLQSRVLGIRVCLGI